MGRETGENHLEYVNTGLAPAMLALGKHAKRTPAFTRVLPFGQVQERSAGIWGLLTPFF